MAPKAADTDAPSRRSSRISAQPKPEAPPAPAAASKKKRAAPAADDEGEATKSKKSKADALPAIDVGDSLPTVTLSNEKGEDVDVGALAADRGLVLFLVPKADTPGCTTQACAFRDSYPSFTETGYAVYCLSADKSAAQEKWQTKKSLPYPLLSDPQRTLITALGAGKDGGTKTTRSHFVFAKGGKLVDKKLNVKAADSAKLALEFVRAYKPSEAEAAVSADA